MCLLRITNDTQSGYSGYTGGVAGKNEGTVSNCKYLGMDPDGLYAIDPVGNNEGSVGNCTALYAVEGNQFEDDGIVTIVSAAGAGAIGGYFPAGCDVTLTLSAAPKDGWTAKGFKYQIYNQEPYSNDDVNLEHVSGDSYLLAGIDRNVTILPNYVYNALSGLEQDAKNRYLITSKEDLLAVVQAVPVTNGCFGMSFLLTRDLMNLGAFTGIAVSEGDEDVTFYGVFDGGGHTISGMKITGDSAYGVGFIGMLGGTLSNLTLENCTVTGTGENAEVGMLAGSGSGSVTNCCVTGGRVEGANAGAIMGTGYMEGKNNFYDSCVTVISGGEAVPTGECGTSQGDRIEYCAARASAYRVSFEDGLGNKLAPDQLVALNGYAEKPVFEELPRREHYTFTDTWQKEDGTEYTFSENNSGDIIYGNTTLFAIWQEDPTITIIQTDGQEDGQSTSYEIHPNQYDNSVTVPENYLKPLEGTKFDSWEFSGRTFLPGDTIHLGESTNEIYFFAVFTDEEYPVAVEPAENGTIEAKDTAIFDELVTVSVNPDPGYELETLTWQTEYGDPVEITQADGNYSFEMPAEAVTVSATFRAIDYTVTAQITGNGMVYVGEREIGNGETATAHYGDAVFLLPDVDYILDSFGVKDAGGNAIGTEEDMFTMPARDVTVTATFSRYIPEFGTPDFVLPAQLTTIEESAFEGDTLITIVDASHCTSIGKDAFKGCTNLTQIKLPGECQIDPAAFDHPVYVFAPANGLTKQCCDAQENLIFVEIPTN